MSVKTLERSLLTNRKLLLLPVGVRLGWQRRATSIAVTSVSVGRDPRQLDHLGPLLGFNEIAELSRNPGYRGDIGLARFAVQDLASPRFGVEEIVREMNAFSKSCDNTGFSNKIFEFAAELLALLGYGEE
jgi:hypothetical protein